MNERDVQKRLVAALRRHHWFVTVFSVPHSVKRQLTDWPDVHAARWDHVHLLECKGPKGQPTVGQLEFRNRIMRHSGPHLRHTFVYPWTDLESILHWGAECKPHGMEYPPEER